MSPTASLDPSERNLKRLIQEMLIRNGVLRTRTEREWNTYATRRILRDFLSLFAAKMGSEKEAAKKAQERPKRPESPRGKRPQGSPKRGKK